MTPHRWFVASLLMIMLVSGLILLVATTNLLPVAQSAGEQGEVRAEAPPTRLSYLPLGLKNYGPAGISDWTRTARIGTPYDYPEEEWVSWEHAVARSVADGVNVLIDWDCISDTYQGRILDPESCLPEIQWMAEYIHEHHPGVHYLIYVAPLEMQTTNSDMNLDGVDDDGKDSTYTDHPDWLQVGIDGRPAVFYGSLPGMPFWVDPSDEDVWLSPSASEYRDLIMDLARDIAATGIDGVWFDLRVLNYSGVSEGDAVPTPVNNIRVTVELPPGLTITSTRKLDFLGNWKAHGFSEPDASRMQNTFNLNIHTVIAFNR